MKTIQQLKEVLEEKEEIEARAYKKYNQILEGVDLDSLTIEEEIDLEEEAGTKSNLYTAQNEVRKAENNLIEKFFELAKNTDELNNKVDVEYLKENVNATVKIHNRVLELAKAI